MSGFEQDQEQSVQIENTKEIVALQSSGELEDTMIDNSSLTEPPEAPASAETEDFQDPQDFQGPEIELPLPVIVALQEREAREEFAGAARTKELAGAPFFAVSAKGGIAHELPRKREEQDVSLSHHSARCSICQHPDREAIEQGFLHWESPTLLAYEYGLGQRRAVYRHARAHGLFAKRGARTRRILEFVMEQGENVTATADSLIRAVRAYSCLGEDGRWTEPTKRVIITHEHVHTYPPQRASGVPVDDDGCLPLDAVDSNGMPDLSPRALAKSPATPPPSHREPRPSTQSERSRATSHQPRATASAPSLATSHQPLATEVVTLGGRASSAQNNGRSEAGFDPSLATRHQPLATASHTLGDGHAVPSRNAVTPAPLTKVGKLMDTLFNRFSRPKPPQKEEPPAALKTRHDGRAAALR